MKLRIRGNSVRLRLTQSEVATAGAGGCVEEVTEFGPGQRLVYAVRPSAQAPAISADLRDGRMEVVIPLRQFEQWASGTDVTLAAEQEIRAGDRLSILVEKDFKCLADRQEDDTDAFPHPSAGSSKC